MSIPEATAPQPATPSGAAILETRYLTKIFGGLTAVDGVSFVVPERSIVSIIGPNGAGKTTFFNMLTGLYRPSLGNVIFDGKDVTTRRPDQITAMGVARTFQNIRLFGTMSAVENVLVGQHARLKATVFGSIVRTPRVRREEREGRDKARELLSYVGVSKRRHDDAASYLSYGDQRRVEIARALGSDPKLLLLDEPTAGMSPEETRAMMELILRLARERTVILVEHKMKLVMGISDRVLVLHHGELLAEGTPDEVRRDETVKRVYLGQREH
jgi:branched-chain amino acid transport system ATP-binding protein